MNTRIHRIHPDFWPDLNGGSLAFSTAEIDYGDTACAQPGTGKLFDAITAVLLRDFLSVVVVVLQSRLGNKAECLIQSTACERTRRYRQLSLPCNSNLSGLRRARK